MMKPLPSIGTVYNTPLADEKQRSVSSSYSFSQQFASFQAGVSRQSATTPSLVCKYCKKPVAHVELTNSGQKVITPGNDDSFSDPELLQPSDIPGFN
ncbi:hypothetical protein CQW23_07326 [Capsicum baccatum]|uniref:Uncharacterized protein n=1 Tax=Capsicum baccatum TaxID=33114 RepID=A0A2G2X5T1_CAPBA|nr:hypothetical protein CQW23_07326 [Capsicum baccatum]